MYLENKEIEGTGKKYKLNGMYVNRSNEIRFKNKVIKNFYRF